MTRPDPAGPDIVSQALARNRLGVPSVVFFGVAGAAPLTVILGAVTTIYAVVGSTVVPVSYLVAAAILAVFTVGFVAMSRHIVNSGAFYSYISRGLGRVVGVGAAFVALPAYAVMQMGLFGLFGVVASGLLDSFGIRSLFRAEILDLDILRVLLAEEQLPADALRKQIEKRGGNNHRQKHWDEPAGALSDIDERLAWGKENSRQPASFAHRRRFRRSFEIRELGGGCHK